MSSTFFIVSSIVSGVLVPILLTFCQFLIAIIVKSTPKPSIFIVGLITLFNYILQLSIWWLALSFIYELADISLANYYKIGYLLTTLWHLFVVGYLMFVNQDKPIFSSYHLGSLRGIMLQSKPKRMYKKKLYLHLAVNIFLMACYALPVMISTAHREWFSWAWSWLF